MKINIFASNFTYKESNVLNIYTSCKNGDINIFPMHESYISSLKDEILTVNKDENKEDKIFLTQGVIHITSNYVNVFSDIAIEINENSLNSLKKNLLHLEKQINTHHQKKNYCTSLEYNFLKKNKAFYELALIKLNEQIKT